MGRELNETEDAKKQRDELWLCYRSLILDVPVSERQNGYRIVTDPAIRFLSNASPPHRLVPVIADVIRKSAQLEARPWQPGQTAEVLRHMESYALNLWDYPWKTEFHTITMFSGFFKIKIENKISHPDDILLLLGYKRVVHCFQLLQMPIRSDVGRVAFDLFLASLECTEMERVANAVKPIGIASRVVFEVRQEVTGDGRVCADHVRERHRLAKAGRGKTAAPTSKPGEGGGGGGKGEAEEEEPREVVDRGDGGGKGDGIGKSTQAYTGLSPSNLRGLGREGVVGSGGVGEGEGGDSETSLTKPTHAGTPGLRALPVDPKPQATGTHGNQMRTESWRVTTDSDANSTVENVYDAVEDLSRRESVYYGFPSADKPQLGTLKTATRKEKKDAGPPRVTGPALWGQTTMEGSNMSFSTFRQERSRSGTEFKDPSSRKSSYHTIESGKMERQELRERIGSQRNPSKVLGLTGRGVRVKGQGEFGAEVEKPTTPGFGAETAAIHHHQQQHQHHLHGYAGCDDDPVATLLHLDPEQMKDPAMRRQILAQLESSTRRNLPPSQVDGVRSPPGRPGFNVDTYSPYQPWQFQVPSDLPRPPLSVYQDPTQGMSLTSGRPSGTLTSGKTRDPWKGDDHGHNETWQCGSCSYENRPVDDACHVCNTSRYL